MEKKRVFEENNEEKKKEKKVFESFLILTEDKKLRNISIDLTEEDWRDWALGKRTIEPVEIENIITNSIIPAK